jgi:3-hydroxyacyl-CoA dehydrogenase
MKTVAIVGAGLVGRSWSVVFARAGWKVKISDPSEEIKRELPVRLQQLIDDLEGVGLIKDGKSVLANITISDTLADALAGVDFVQESGPEQVEAKKAIFAEVDRLAPPNAVIASSSTAIVSSAFTEHVAGRARCLIGHPVNPPHLVPIVEICPAPWTSPEAVKTAREVYESIDQVPVSISREIEGFVINRLQSAVLSEALRLVADGIISPQDLDHTVKNGLGLRWSFIGPFETIELNAPNGIPDYLSRFGPAFQRIAADPPGAKVWDADTVAKLAAAWGPPDQAKMKAKAAWRDKTLAALMAHKKSTPKFSGD